MTGPPAAICRLNSGTTLPLLPQHIAETHHCVLRPGSTGIALDDHLADPLGRAHNVGWAHCLVGGNHYKLLYVILIRLIRHDLGSHHIILNSLPRVVLHQGHMLVGCRVIDDLRPVGTEYTVHPFPVADAGDHHAQVQLREFLFQFILQVVSVVLINI